MNPSRFDTGPAGAAEGSVRRPIGPGPDPARAGSLNTTIILALERASFSLDPGRGPRKGVWAEERV